MIFDTHAHYDDEAFDEDRDEVLTSLRERGVGTVVNVGASMEGSRRSVSLSEEYEFVYSAVGVHPDEVGELREEDMEWMREQLQKPKVVAVGEIGLDYYWDKEGHDLQKKWFLRQLKLAKELKKPVIIHSREAAADTMELLKANYHGEMPMVMHCYSYSPEMAREYRKMGLYLGIGGVLTFKNAKKLKETVLESPMEYLLLETDCPYLAPVPNRGKRNDSGMLKYVVQELAATLTGTNNTGTLTYKWYRSGEDVPIATDTDKYTLTADDIGQTITAMVKSSKELGSMTAVTKVVEKADGPAAPAAFTLGFALNDDQKTFTATIPEVKNAEYSFDGKQYSAVNTKTDCAPNTEYTGYVRIPETDTQKASAVTSSTQTAPKLTVAAPVFKPDGATSFRGTQMVEIYCATPGASIYYTTDGTTPTSTGTIYSGAISLTSTTTIKAIAVKADMNGSAVAEATFTRRSSSGGGGGGGNAQELFGGLRGPDVSGAV